MNSKKVSPAYLRRSEAISSRWIEEDFPERSLSARLRARLGARGSVAVYKYCKNSGGRGGGDPKYRAGCCCCRCCCAASDSEGFLVSLLCHCGKDGAAPRAREKPRFRAGSPEGAVRSCRAPAAWKWWFQALLFFFRFSAKLVRLCSRSNSAYWNERISAHSLCDPVLAVWRGTLLSKAPTIWWVVGTLWFYYDLPAPSVGYQQDELRRETPSRSFHFL